MMLGKLSRIEADSLSQLVYALAFDGWPNDQICKAVDMKEQKIESTLRAIRVTGVVIDRPAISAARFFRLAYIGHLVSNNLRKQVAFYKDLEHPQPAIVAARRVGKMFGRSEDWVNAVAHWHRIGIAAARADLGL